MGRIKILKRKLYSTILRLYIKLFPVRQKYLWNLWSNYFDDSEEQVAIHEWIDEALTIIENRKPQSLLEVGVGFGRNLMELHRREMDISDFYGIDLSENMIRLAKRNLPQISNNFSVADILDLSFFQNNVDVVFVPFVLMHISHDKLSQALQNIVSVAETDIIIIDEYRETENDYEIVNKYTTAHNHVKIIKAQFPQLQLVHSSFHDKWQVLHYKIT